MTDEQQLQTNSRRLSANNLFTAAEAAVAAAEAASIADEPLHTQSSIDTIFLPCRPVQMFSPVYDEP